LRSSIALELYIPMFVIVEFVDHSISCFAIHFIKFIRTSVFQAPRTSIIHQGNKIAKKDHLDEIKRGNRMPQPHQHSR
jgi:hypothetical protein